MQLTSWLDVLREINLKRIEHEAESRFALWLIGDPADTARLAARLGRGQGAIERHPWVVEHALPVPAGLEIDLPALALVVSREPELDAERSATLRRLQKAGARTVTVVLTDAPAVPATTWVARAGEDARVVLPRTADEAAMQAAFEPVLARIDRLTEGSLFLAMARQLPALRPWYVRALLEDVARTNAGFALSTGLADLVPGLSLPLTAADVVVLTKNQIVMAYRIALAAGKPAETRLLVSQVLGVIGAGMLLRQIARELVGLLPAIGLVPKVAVAYAGTHLVGSAVRAWALEGRQVDIGELRQLYETSLAGGRAVAEEMVARARSRRERGAGGAPRRGDDGQEGKRWQS